MTTIQCRIGERHYRLDYDRSRITSGRIFHGTVFMDHIVDFYCEVPDEDGKPLFSPVTIRAEIRDAVLQAVLEHEGNDPGHSSE